MVRRSIVCIEFPSERLTQLAFFSIFVLYIFSLVPNNFPSTFAFVIDLVPPKITPFTFGGEPMNYDETVSVTCTVSGGDSPINFMWKFNRAPIEPYLEVLTEKRGKRINVLMIESLKAKHAGNYTCVAANAAGVAEHASELIVNG